MIEDGRILAGRFLLIRMIGKGGMGSVWEAEQPALERRVAIKILHPELAERPLLVQRFNREARAIGKLNHPNILTIHECSQSDGYNFLVMPYLEGESLSQVLLREPRLPTPRAVELWLTIARAMAAAHQQGVLHRDLKPANIFLSKPIVEGAEPHVTVLDFGIAKLLGPRSTGLRTDPGHHMGTPSYMAPEQFGNAERADESADVYALGVLLYELLAGHRAFTKTVKVLADRVVVALEAIAPQVPASVARVVTEMMAENPAERPTVAVACAVLEAYSRRLRQASTALVPLHSKPALAPTAPVPVPVPPTALAPGPPRAPAPVAVTLSKRRPRDRFARSATCASSTCGRACSTIAGDRSIAQTRSPRDVKSRACRPVPQPTSSKESPGLGMSRSKIA